MNALLSRNQYRNCTPAITTTSAYPHLGYVVTVRYLTILALDTNAALARKTINDTDLLEKIHLKKEKNTEISSVKLQISATVMMHLLLTVKLPLKLKCLVPVELNC